MSGLASRPRCETLPRGFATCRLTGGLLGSGHSNCDRENGGGKRAGPGDS